MLSDRHIYLAFVVGMGFLLFARAPVYVDILWVVACTIPLAWGSYYIGSGIYMHALCHGPRDQRQIAITFDDGPAGMHTPAILDVLKAQGVEAVFFCIGERIQGNEEMLKSMDGQGHIIGNHSHSHHKWFDLFSARRMEEDLRRMDRALEQAIGRRPLLFRPPYGVTNPNVRRAVKRGGYITVGWNVRSLDTVIKDPNALLEKVYARLKPGAIVLFHDTCASTLSMLPAFIERARQAGYELVRLDKMCNLTPYA